MLFLYISNLYSVKKLIFLKENIEYIHDASSVDNSIQNEDYREL